MEVIVNEGNNNLNVTMVRITGSLIVTVRDADTQGAIAGVLVVLDGQNASTNSAGQCTFLDVAPGTYNISFTKDGYEPIP